jgi:hypothetical protein
VAVASSDLLGRALWVAEGRSAEARDLKAEERSERARTPPVTCLLPDSHLHKASRVAESNRARAPTRKAATFATAGSATRRSAKRELTPQFKQRRHDDHAAMASALETKRRSTDWLDSPLGTKNWGARQRFTCAA